MAILPHHNFVVQVRQLNHWYGKGESRLQVLYDINLDIPRGAVVMVRGPSGSGKTTLLTLLGCLRRVEDGSVKLMGQELLGASEETLTAMRRYLGFVFQFHNLHSALTAMENVRMGIDVHRYDGTVAKGTNWQEAASTMLGLVGLADRKNYYIDNLSGGQKQRVAIARALVGNPELLFADEPTAALDIDTGLRVIELMKAIGKERGMTTMLVTHDTRLQHLADMKIDLEDGRLVVAS